MHVCVMGILEVRVVLLPRHRQRLRKAALLCGLKQLYIIYVDKQLCMEGSGVRAFNNNNRLATIEL